MRYAVLLLAALALTGCAKQIDSTKVEDRITKLVDGGGFIHLQSVKCPPGLAARAGRKFDCKVTAKDGSTIDVEVDMLDAKGKVHIAEPDILGEQSVESGVVHSVTKATGYSDVTAKCPEIIPSGSGKTVRCVVSGGGKTRKLTVLQTDDDGGFRLLGLLQ